jgi:hypothetical protein
MVGEDQVWPVGPPPTGSDFPYLYGVDQVVRPNRYVDFTVLKGFVPENESNDKFYFRCVQFSSLNGYVGRTFTKLFPAYTSSHLDCQLEDQYGDGTSNPEMKKSITFQVIPTVAALIAPNV